MGSFFKISPQSFRRGLKCIKWQDWKDFQSQDDKKEWQKKTNWREHDLHTTIFLWLFFALPITLLQDSYDLFTTFYLQLALNFLKTSQTNFLWISCSFPQTIPRSYYFLMSFLWISFNLLTTSLWLSLDIRMNFLQHFYDLPMIQISYLLYNLPMTFLQLAYDSLMTYLQFSYDLSSTLQWLLGLKGLQWQHYKDLETTGSSWATRRLNNQILLQ